MSYDYQRSYRVRRRAKATAHLGGQCVVCGSDEDLQFDHVDPKTKVIEITQAIVAGWSWERLLVELSKCQLLCRAHHAKKSAWEGSLNNPWNKIEDPRHGTGAAYSRLRCRCEHCKEWKANYRKGIVNHAGTPL